MAPFVQLQMLLLLTLLEFSGVTEQTPDVFVEEEADVTLTCDTVRGGQDGCNGTTWIYSTSRNPPVEMITHGRISPSFQNKSDRLIFTENCSLIFKNVQSKRAGRYLCQEHETSGHVSEAAVSLSIVSLTEIIQINDSEVALTCHVSTPQRCSTVKVKWIYNDTDINHPAIRTAEFLCGTSASVPTSLYLESLRPTLFKCEVSLDNIIRDFSLRPEEPEQTTTTQTSPKSNSGAAKRGDTSAGWWWILLLGPVALTVTAVGLVTWKRNTVKPQEVDDGHADPEEAVSYASIHFTKKPDRKSKPQLREDEEEDGSVTYRSVKTLASESPGELYTTVRKHQQQD